MWNFGDKGWGIIIWNDVFEYPVDKGESYTGYYSLPASQDVELLMRQAYRHTCEGNCRLGCPPGMIVMDYLD